ncbi:MAG: DUF1934 family protein [Erysipelotrichaceae bacterium]
MKVIYTDCLTNEIETLYKLEKQDIKPNHFSYHEDQAKVEIHYQDDEVMIRRRSDLSFDLRLILRRRTRCEIVSESGSMLLEAYTLRIEITTNSVEVEYYLLAQTETVAHKMVKFEFEH